ncbi:MAG: UvrB/UvrC motif-containing protein [Clostridia bacterium]|nr:UvrB/UvrC motif-containing protein [Clostridia bacterium]
MVCQNCGKKTATAHIKTIVNGTLTEYDLCTDCAREKGYTNFFKEMHLDFGSLMGGFIGGASPQSTVVRCPSCGASFAEISESGKIGCAECYGFFREKLMPTIRRIHGSARHKGKIPGTAALRIVEPAGKMTVLAQPQIEKKKTELKKAIEEQNFEYAAELRDEIRELEKGETDRG